MDITKPLTEEELASVSEATRQANAEFVKLSGPKKRVTIAKDVLKQLALKKIVAKTGTWIGIDQPLSMARAVPFSDFMDMQACDALEKLPSCNACALGAMFASGLRRADRYTVRDARWASFGDIVAYFAGVFSQKQLMLIEACFEKRRRGIFANGVSAAWAHISGRKQDGVVKWVRLARGLNARQRMEKIMRNIVRNNGTFVLPKT